MSGSIIVRAPYDVCNDTFPHQVNCENRRFRKCGDAYCPFRDDSPQADNVCGTWLGKENYCCYMAGGGIYATCHEDPTIETAASIDSIGTDLIQCGVDTVRVTATECCSENSLSVFLYNTGSNQDTPAGIRCYDWNDAGTSPSESDSPSPTQSSGGSSTSSPGGGSGTGSPSPSSTPNNAIKKSASYVLGAVCALMFVGAQL